MSDQCIRLLRVLFFGIEIEIDPDFDFDDRRYTPRVSGSQMTL